MKKKVNIVGAIQAVLAILIAAALGIAAKRSFELGVIRVIEAQFAAQETYSQYPLTDAQMEYKSKRDEDDMEAAKRELKECRTLGRVLIYAQILPLALLFSAGWLILLANRDSTAVEQKDEPDQ